MLLLCNQYQHNNSRSLCARIIIKGINEVNGIISPGSAILCIEELQQQSTFSVCRAEWTDAAFAVVRSAGESEEVGLFGDVLRYSAALWQKRRRFAEAALLPGTSGRMRADNVDVADAVQETRTGVILTALAQRALFHTPTLLLTSKRCLGHSSATHYNPVPWVRPSRTPRRTHGEHRGRPPTDGRGRHGFPHSPSALRLPSSHTRPEQGPQMLGVATLYMRLCPVPQGCGTAP